MNTQLSAWLAEVDDFEVDAVLELLLILSPTLGRLWYEHKGKCFYEKLALESF